MDPFTPIFGALDAAGVRYVVVGGLAAVLHGQPRLTADVDLVLDLEPAPVELAEFADPERRRSWVRTQGLRVRSLFDPGQPMREVDLFAESPMDIEALEAIARRRGGRR
jgi:hypothetical protein